MKSNRPKIFVFTATALLLLQALTVLVSWVVNALWPSLGINSLLSGSGVRWLFSSMPDNFCDKTLVWILLFGIFFGTFWWSKLPKKFISFSDKDYREKFAIAVFLIVMFIALCICLLFAFFPHSVFLGVSGHLVPGPFLNAVALVMGFALYGGSIVYLLLSGKVDDYASMEKACLFGLQYIAPVIVIYFLLKELVEMLRFVL